MTQQTQTKTIVEVYDPAMCCSTGVCGTEVDDALVDFANDVKWLKSQGVDVIRYNLGQEPEAFKQQSLVLSRLQAEGSECLPLILINGDVVAEGGYPDRKQLITMLGLGSDEHQPTTESAPTKTSQNIITEHVRELIALGAALAANCESGLTFHFNKARDLGITEEEIVQTLQIAQNVKQVPAGTMIQLANTLLGVHSSNGCVPGSGCC
ncbi:MAG: arsenical resistance operon transcriptional repressor ArsD [Balneolaceae bacterium]|nr:MAG: arsenical resistance operon transcriptional repressor ArsD [Balneolaceae bacterium]